MEDFEKIARIILFGIISFVLFVIFTKIHHYGDNALIPQIARNPHEQQVYSYLLLGGIYGVKYAIISRVWWLVGYYYPKLPVM